MKKKKKYSDDLERAEEFLKIAESLVESSLKTSANRLYFALENAVSAFIKFSQKEVPKNHQKLWEISRELGDDYYNSLRELYDLRMRADYGIASTIVVLNKEKIQHCLKVVRGMIENVRRKLLGDNHKQNKKEAQSNYTKIVL